MFNNIHLDVISRASSLERQWDYASSVAGFQVERPWPKIRIRIWRVSTELKWNWRIYGCSEKVLNLMMIDDWWLTTHINDNNKADRPSSFPHQIFHQNHVELHYKWIVYRKSCLNLTMHFDELQSFRHSITFMYQALCLTPYPPRYVLIKWKHSLLFPPNSKHFRLVSFRKNSHFSNWKGKS